MFRWFYLSFGVESVSSVWFGLSSSSSVWIGAGSAGSVGFSNEFLYRICAQDKFTQL